MALEYRDSRRVGYGASEYFSMVMDVDRYEEFLPYCTASRVIEKRGEDEMLAKMVLTFRGMSHSYTSRVKTWHGEGGELRIEVSQYGKGPFSVLRNEWLFFPEGEGSCRVEFLLEMGLSSRVLEGLVGGLMKGMGKRMVHAFESRALFLYGKRAVVGV